MEEVKNAGKPQKKTKHQINRENLCNLDRCNWFSASDVKKLSSGSCCEEKRCCSHYSSVDVQFGRNQILRIGNRNKQGGFGDF